ncbi:hypothetical protein FOXB_10696 [Fusarium oxysporum f. sp. conglutinans Fo5176]|uniref:Uncharacterized protein n=1 Tax=Fusarium oxysporum (strain Fo5176) TaxID=660025 RepID=F9FWB4_FUSOF|nr:hypothetical protein FOXB_10696 [Fusarium oxysporum f. sp. conglutinans Fo5176]
MRNNSVIQNSPTWAQKKAIGQSVSRYWQAAFTDFFYSLLPQKNGKPFVSYLAHDFLRVSKVAIPSPTHEFLKLSQGENGLVSRLGILGVFFFDQVVHMS